LEPVALILPPNLKSGLATELPTNTNNFIRILRAFTFQNFVKFYSFRVPQLHPCTDGVDFSTPDFTPIFTMC